MEKKNHIIIFFNFIILSENVIIECKNLFKRGEIIVAELTPMMQQYIKTKEEYPDCILTVSCFID